MKRFSISQLVVVIVILLLGCDVTLLFAAEQNPNPTTGLTPEMTANAEATQLQLQQLRQVAANNTPNPDTAANIALTPSASSTANTTTTPIATTTTQTTTPASAPVASTPPPTSSAAISPVVVPPQPVNALNSPSLPQGADLTNAPPAGSDAADISDQAFQGIARNTLPMTPEQIQRLRQLFTSTQYAASLPVGVPPKPVIRSQMVNLAPGTTPPPIRMKQGVVTTLAFIDVTGQPWPIEAYDIGDPTTFNVQWNKTDNVLFVQPSKQFFDDRNLVVRLRGLPTPVTLTLLAPQLSNQNAVDYRVDLHIPESGPNAAPMTGGDNLPNSADPVLLGVLSGVPPEGSKELTVSDHVSQAWILGDKLYLRTRTTVLSPAWIATMSSADGMKAYLMPKTPMILVSQHGKAVQLRVEGL